MRQFTPDGWPSKRMTERHLCHHFKILCPVFPHAKDQRHWSFPDPSKATGSEEERLAVYRNVRDAIRQRIENELLTAGQPEKDDLPA